MDEEKVAIVGVGAIGGAAAAALADLGRHSLVLCTRTPFDQLVVKHPGGNSEVDAPVLCDPADAKSLPLPMDWVLLATKAHHSDGARPWLEALCGSGTKVAVLQNGVDHVERISPMISASTSVLPVVVQLPAEKTSPGQIEQSHSGSLVVPDDEMGLAFVALFRGARIDVRPVADFLTQAWWKLVFNAALGGICALTVRDDTVGEDPALQELLLMLMREVAEVGRAVGAKLPEDAPERLLKRISTGATGHWSSISADRREHRPMEWRVRNEVVGRYGRAHGIATPHNDTITTLLRVADAAYRGGD